MRHSIILCGKILTHPTMTCWIALLLFVVSAECSCFCGSYLDAQTKLCVLCDENSFVVESSSKIHVDRAVQLSRIRKEDGGGPVIQEPKITHCSVCPHSKEGSCQCQLKVLDNSTISAPEKPMVPPSTPSVPSTASSVSSTTSAQTKVLFISYKVSQILLNLNTTNAKTIFSDKNNLNTFQKTIADIQDFCNVTNISVFGSSLYIPEQQINRVGHRTVNGRSKGTPSLIQRYLYSISGVPVQINYTITMEIKSILQLGECAKLYEKSISSLRNSVGTGYFDTVLQANARSYHSQTFENAIDIFSPLVGPMVITGSKMVPNASSFLYVFIITLTLAACLVSKQKPIICFYESKSNMLNKFD